MPAFTKADADKLKAELKRNADRLDFCDLPHVFRGIGKSVLSMTWRCVKCRGEIKPREAYWYQQGLRHGANSR